MMKRIIFGLLFAASLSCPVHAQTFLRQSTASQAIKIGPFVDSTDGNTEKTGLTIANTDVHISKNGGTIAAKNSGGCTHDANGWYTCTLDATDTNTVGRLSLYVHVAGALPVWRSYQVLEEAVYDRDFASSALGYVANAPVNVAQAAGVAWGSGAITAASIADGAIDNATFACTGGSFLILGVTDCGTAQSATSTSLVLRSAATFADDTTIGGTLMVQGSTQGYPQERVVTDNVGSTDTQTVDAWAVTPSGTITYYLFGTAPTSASAAADVNVTSWNGTALSTTNPLPNAAAGASGGLPLGDTNGAVKVSNGTGTGQLSFTSGVLAANVTQFGGSAGTFTSGQPTVRISSGTGTGQISLSSGAVLLQPTQTGVTIPTVTTVAGVGASGITASSFAADAITAAKVASDVGTEFATALQRQTLDTTVSGSVGAAINAAGSAGDPWATSVPGGYAAGTAGYLIGTYIDAAISSRLASLTFPTNFSSLAISGAGGVTATTVGDKSGYSLTVTPPTAAQVSAQVLADQKIIIGTCDSGTATACTDDALTQTSNVQLAGRLVCFGDDYCSLIGSFNPATDTMNLTKSDAPSTRASKTYAIYPATTQ